MSLHVTGLQGRFAKHVFPGETLRTEMWHQPGSTIVLQVRVVERDAIALTNAAVVLRKSDSPHAAKL